MTALRDWTASVRSAESASDHAPAGSVDSTRLKVDAERQRIAIALHDDVTPLLFGMASRIARALAENGDTADAGSLLGTLRTLDEELRVAQQQLRTVIRASGPGEPAEGVPAATQRDIEAFTERTGVPAHLVVRGVPVQLPVAVERASLHCLRQALVNVERHAHAALTMVTLIYRRDSFCLVVQDDGRGLPAGFEPRAIPVDGHWGFTSMAEQVERLGGSVQLRRMGEGGTQLRVVLPVAR